MNTDLDRVAIKQWIAAAAGVVSVLLLAEFWLHYFVLFRLGVGYPMGLNGIAVAMSLAFFGALIAAFRNRAWVGSSVVALASFVFVLSRIH